jgi:hypothetical protein
MSVMLDGKLIFVLNLIGFNWPQADEDKLKESARHWREYASELDRVIADTNRILLQVRADNSGESIDALEQHWRDFGEHMRKGHAAAVVVAEVLEDFALAVEALKAAVAIQLGILAGELAATTGAAFLTFGVAEAAAPGEILLTQAIVRGAVRVAIQKVERLVADKVAKKVVEHFLNIKNGLKALKAAPTVLKDFGKGLVRGRRQPPVVVFDQTRGPGLKVTFDKAIAQGKSAEVRRLRSKPLIRRNRREALRGQKAAPAGQSLDEFPFASTHEGGAGSAVNPVLEAEQDYQGGVLSNFYKEHNIRDGDRFKVGWR